MKTLCKKLNYLFSFVFVLSVFWVGGTVFADTPLERSASINSNGDVTSVINGCPTTAMYGLAMYHGYYPDTSSPVNSSNLNGNNCTTMTTSGNLEDGWWNNAGNTTDGHYWVKYTLTGSAFTPDYTGTWYYFSANRTSGVWSGTGYSDTSYTHILSWTPENESVINAQTPPFDSSLLADIDVSVDIYYNDLLSSGVYDKVCVEIENLELSSGINYIPQCENIISSGVSTLNFTFPNMPKGRYYLIAYFSNNEFQKDFPISSEFIHQFSSLGNQSCLYGQEIDGTCAGIGGPLGTNYSSTTPFEISGLPIEDCSTMTDLPTKASCAISNSINRSINFLFVPDGYVLKRMITDFHDNALTHFPLGYVTDLVEIFSTTTKSSLTVLNAKLPSALGFGSPEISLDLTGVLDPILNATTTVYNNNTASSTQTFFQITNYYWEIFVYLSAFFYILSRILGSRLIPHNRIKL